MKKNIIITIIFCLLSSFSVPAYANSYSDIKGHWAEESINQAVNWGLISGYPEGNFSPDTPITLAELLTMLVPMVSGEKPEITDETDWYIPYVDKAFELGILNGFTVKELEGFYDAPAMRMVANTLFANSLVCLDLANEYQLNDKLAEKARLGLVTFVDSDDFYSNLFAVSTYSCVAHEIVIGNQYRELQPYSYLTRAEAVTMLKRVKAYQLKRLSGMHYADPFTFGDYFFTCVKTASGTVYPIENSDRPIVKDNGIIYMSTVGISKILESCEMDFEIHPSLPGDIYNRFYEYYISINSSDFYTHINAEDNFYGYSNNYTGVISGPNGKNYEFTCGADSDAGLVVRNIPMLPVRDVLDFFEIPYKDITLSPETASVIVDFSKK